MAAATFILYTLYLILPDMAAATSSTLPPSHGTIRLPAASITAL